MATRKKRRVYRKKRRNPVSRRKYSKARRHRPVAYSVGRGKRRKLYRSPKARLMPRRINKRRRYKRRRNPAGMLKKFKLQSYFGKNRLMRGVALIGGIGLGAFGKSMLSSTMNNNAMVNKFGSVALLIAGAILNNKGRRAEVKALGTGIVAFSIYDLLTQNIPFLTAYLPTIGAPTFNRAPAATVEGGMSYGRSMYGASLPRNGNAEIVEGNISSTQAPEIVGEELDLSDALEMSV